MNSMTNLSLKCKCGAVEGEISHVSPKVGNHVVCYCNDCQAFANHLSADDDILDPWGGTEVYQTAPWHISIHKGIENIRCLRLTPKGRELGLVDDTRWRRFESKREAIERETERLATTWIHPGTPQAHQLENRLGKSIGREYSLADLLKRPELEYGDVAGLKGEPTPDTQAAEQVAIQAKYAGYIDRQREDIERLRRHEQTPLPADLDYAVVDGLSNEVRQKLSEARPETLARAGRIPGVTPAAVSLLLIYLKKRGALERAGPVDPDSAGRRELA